MRTRLAHAKLNLILRVDAPLTDGPRRGWHPIASWMHAIDLADELSFERLGEGSQVVVEWMDDAPRPTPIDWPMDRDLVARAHAALERRCGRALPVAIRVRKRIPIGAGLGGGSSDAACALVAINELFKIGLEHDELRAIGLSLGSDVPFLIDARVPPRPAVVTGFGETIRRVPPRDDALLLIVPRVSCSTPAVYGAFDATGAPTTPTSDAQIIERALGDPAEAMLFNDLGDAAFTLAPSLGELHRDLAGELAPARVHLTGSGSALFTFADDRDRIESVAARHGAVVVLTRLA